MTRSIHFISQSIAGSSGPPHSRCIIPCSGLSVRALGLSPNSSSHGSYKLIFNKTNLSLKCSFRNVACSANPKNYRRSLDSSDRKSSRNSNNRYDEDRDDEFENLEGPKIGPFTPISSNPRSQPGLREKEIVELFKKIQAQLRQRAAMKEEGKKAKTSQGKCKESETVDSLLKLLRKHLAQHDKKTTFSANDQENLILDQQKQAGSSPGPVHHMKDDEIKENPKQSLGRPKSSFSKRSPVPEIKFQPIYSEGSIDSISHDNLERASEMCSLESEAEDEPLSEPDSDESDVDPMFLEGNELDEISGLYDEDESDSEGMFKEEDNRAEAGDLSGKKLPELRSLAKSRGLKGYSKLKKSELIELLSE